MIDLLTDVRTAAEVFRDIRGLRKKGLEPSAKVLAKMTFINARPAFYDTAEGCMFANRDKELHNAVWEVFKELSYEDKRALCFTPENGRFLARAQLWERELGPALPPRQYHKAMGSILHQLVEIKQRVRAV